MGRSSFLSRSLGVIALASAIEGIVAHPSEPLDLANRFALGVGVVLFTGTMSVALWRATRKLHALRLGLSLATCVAIVAVEEVVPIFTLSIAFAGSVLIGVLEHRKYRGHESVPTL